MPMPGRVPASASHRNQAGLCVAAKGPRSRTGGRIAGHEAMAAADLNPGRGFKDADRVVEPWAHPRAAGAGSGDRPSLATRPH